jgi:uncharacterized protein YunC (DUF1805 family)
VKLEDLLTNNADYLENLTDEQLEAVLKPYLPVTRPELAKESAAIAIRVPKQKTFEEMEKEAKIKHAKEIAKKMGINI